MKTKQRLYGKVTHVRKRGSCMPVSKVFRVIFVFSLFIYSDVLAQSHTITGKVTDEHNIPVSYASVYISGSTSGATTDSLGNYFFKTGLSGNYQLVASFVGYVAVVKNIKLDEKNNLNVNFSLKENLVQLNNLEVVASNSEWRGRLKDFLSFFIGTDNYAEFTEVENPEILNFEQKEGSNTLSVVADVPLKIVNNAIGYRLSVILGDIEFDRVNYTGFYKVYPQFILLEAEHESIRKKWRDNRKYIYEGSSRHFFKSLYKNSTTKENFTMIPTWGFKEVEEKRLIDYYIRKTIKIDYSIYTGFKFENIQVNVGYNITFNKAGHVTNKDKLTKITPANNESVFFIDEYGILFDPTSISFSGKWTEEKISRLLPFAYTLDD